MGVSGATRLTAEDCAEAMRNGDFGPAVREAADRVAVVLTQAWCPQWVMMARWLGAAAEAGGARVFYIEYDREDFYDVFMTWKEDVLGNRLIPYVRYYAGGRLTGESNYVGKDAFAAALLRDRPEHP